MVYEFLKGIIKICLAQMDIPTSETGVQAIILPLHLKRETHFQLHVLAGKKGLCAR